MKDKYTIESVGENQNRRWIINLNGKYVQDYSTRKDARIGRKAWMDLFDFTNLPPVEEKTIKYYNAEGEIYP